jgi:putative PIG3 family NAD(P)H quinone oxidoreductase
MTTRAIVLTEYGGPDVLRISTVPDPAPGPREVLVAVRAAGLNRADLMQRRGRYPAPDPKPAFDIPGLEMAGDIVAVGRDVVGWGVGDRVMALLPGGGYAEYVTVPDRMLLRLPPGWSYEQGAAVPEAFITAHDALQQIGVGLGDWVLVHAGASGVGTSAVQLARAMGAQVVATCGSDEKAARVAALGATRTVNYRREDFVSVVADVTGGHGVDGIVDLVGGSYLERNLQALALKGRMIVVGTVGGSEAPLNLGLLMARRATVIGTLLRARPPEEKMAATQRLAHHVWPLLASGQIAPVLDQVFSWHDAAAAHQRLEDNLNIGKVVLRID